MNLIKIVLLMVVAVLFGSESVSADTVLKGASTDKKLVSINLTANTVTPIVTTPDVPDSVLMDPKGNEIYTEPLKNEVHLFDPVANTDTVLAGAPDGINGPRDLVLDPTGGSVLVSNFLGGTISRINLSTKATTTLTSGLPEPQGIVFDATGRLFVVAGGSGDCSFAGNSRVFQIDPVAGTILKTSPISFDPTNSLDGLTYDSFTHLLFTISKCGGVLSAVDPTTLNPLISTPLGASTYPDGVQADGNGNIFISWHKDLGAGTNAQVAIYNLPSNTLTPSTVVPGLAGIAPLALLPPVINKQFLASAIPLLGNTVLTFTLTNPNAAGNSVTVNFTDTFPPGLMVATPNGLSNGCGGIATAGAGSVTLSMAVLTATCTLSVNVTGVLLGTWTNNVTVNFQGGTGNTSSASISVGIASPSPSITTTSLPDGTAGVPYNGSVDGTGGVPPYTFGATGLPTNLHMGTDGKITGTPTTPGTSTVVITLTDSTTPTAQTATKSLPLNILPGGGTLPTAVSVNPNTGAGVTQEFAAVYRDPAGSADWSKVHLLFNSSPTGAGGCWTYLDVVANAIFLMNDQGTAPVPGSIDVNRPRATLANSQCSVFSQDAPSQSGNNLTFPIYVTFMPNFTGRKNIYGKAEGVGGATSGFQLLGDWTPNAVAPVSISTTSLPNGTAGIPYNGSVDATGGVKPYTFGATGLPPNLQISTTGNITGTPTTQGTTTATITVTDSTTPTHQTATKNLPITIVAGGGSLPTAVSVNPNSGGGATQNFVALYTDPAGSADFSKVHLLFNSSPNGAGGCWAFLDVAANAIYLMNDQGTAPVIGFIDPNRGRATLTNSQCSISSPASPTISGNSLSLPLYITFSASFTGQKTIFGKAEGMNGATSGFQSLGNWTPNGGPIPAR